MELVKFGLGNSQWQMLGVDPSSNMYGARPTGELLICKQSLEYSIFNIFVLALDDA
jgi:hypothetical protein